MKNILLFIFLPFISVAQARYYVHESAQGTNSGETWQNAFTGLQAALQLAAAGDEVWVAQGMYKPAAAIRTVSFEPRSGVKIYGGFAGTETSLSQRDWLQYSTILSGDIGIAGDSTDNSLNVMYLFEPDSSTVVDGFVVQDGNASNGGGQTFSSQRQYCGGGLYIMGNNGDAYALVQHCIFRRNTAQSSGGGIMINGSGPLSVIGVQVKDCLFEQNRALFYGGGFFRSGGGIVNRGTNIERCHFTGNQAFVGGGLSYIDNNGADTMAIRFCFFDHNTATNWGGGAYFAPERNTPTSLIVDSCRFEGNAAKYGTALDVFPVNGAIFEGVIEVSRSVFTQNIDIIVTGGRVVRISVFGNENSGVRLDCCKIYNNIFLPQTVLAVELNCGYGYLIIKRDSIDEKAIPLLAGDFASNLIEKSFFVMRETDNTLFYTGTADLLIKNSVLIIEGVYLSSESILDAGDPSPTLSNCYIRSSSLGYLTSTSGTVFLSNCA